MNIKVRPLYSVRQAQVAGFREGILCRQSGNRPAMLDVTRMLRFEDDPEYRRGRHVLHYRAWREAFDAGYLGNHRYWPKSPPTPLITVPNL